VVSHLVCRPIMAPPPPIAIEDITRIIAAIHSTDLIGLAITTGMDVHIDITVTACRWKKGART
jgi:hypothetical protein